MTTERIRCSVSEKEASVGNLDNLEGRSKIISQTIKMAPCQQPKSGTLVTITTDVRHNNGEQGCSNEASSKTLSRSASKRMTDPSPRSTRVVTFHDEKEKAVKIEERSVILSIFAVCPVRQCTIFFVFYEE